MPKPRPQIDSPRTLIREYGSAPAAAGAAAGILSAAVSIVPVRRWPGPLRAAHLCGGPAAAAETAVVERVVDGDTLVVALDGEQGRLLNIDTPRRSARTGPSNASALRSRRPGSRPKPMARGVFAEDLDCTPAIP